MEQNPSDKTTADNAKSEVPETVPVKNEVSTKEGKKSSELEKKKLSKKLSKGKKSSELEKKKLSTEKEAQESSELEKKKLSAEQEAKKSAELDQRKLSAEKEANEIVVKLMYQHALAKAVHNENLQDNEQEKHFQALKNEKHGLNQFENECYFHLGNYETEEEKAYEIELEQKEPNTKGNAGNKTTSEGKEHIIRTAHKKRRHRITKERFMRCVDLELIKSALKSAKLDKSLLWEDDFDVSKLSFEKFMQCRRDMLRMEVIMEALKEGLLDKPGTSDKRLEDVEVPDEDSLHKFEREAKEALKKEHLKEEEAILERTRKIALELGAANEPEGNEEAIGKALDEAKEMINRLNRKRGLLGQEKSGEDSYKKLVKTLREPDSPDDEWTEITSTTTGSYKSWRRGDGPLHKGKTNRPKLKNPNWADQEKHLGIRFIAAIIIFGYWVHYIARAFKRLWYDIYTEQLIMNNIWPVLLEHVSLEWSYFAMKLHSWIHCIFTIIAPSIVIGNHTSLGVVYGFSIMIDGYFYMFAKGHDLLFEPNEPTWETAISLIFFAVLISAIVVFFLILHYVVEDPVRVLRETLHRKVRRLNRLIYAKTCGTLEQRMIAWDWMIRHATQRELRKLSRLYPEIKKVNGHYPIPEKDEVEFDLNKELRLFRLRHMFYDITMTGGWVNMEKYQQDLFGSGGSSEEETLEDLKTRKKKVSKIQPTAQFGTNRFMSSKNPPKEGQGDQKNEIKTKKEPEPTQLSTNQTKVVEEKKISQTPGLENNEIQSERRPTIESQTSKDKKRSTLKNDDKTNMETTLQDPSNQKPKKQSKE